MTKYGKLISDIIYNSDKHLTAEQIYIKMKENSSGIVLATVYNNLNSLVTQGKLRRITVQGSPDRYDKATRHDHLVCDKCGKLSDVFIKDITANIEKEIGCSISSYDLSVHYICDNCKKNKEKSTFNK